MNYTPRFDLRLLRFMLDLSQDELARRAGVSQTAFRRVENGRPKVSPKVRRAILGVLVEEAAIRTSSDQAHTPPEAA